VTFLKRMTKERLIAASYVLFIRVLGY